MLSPSTPRGLRGGVNCSKYENHILGARTITHLQGAGSGSPLSRSGPQRLLEHSTCVRDALTKGKHYKLQKIQMIII